MLNKLGSHSPLCKIVPPLLPTARHLPLSQSIPDRDRDEPVATVAQVMPLSMLRNTAALFPLAIQIPLSQSISCCTPPNNEPEEITDQVAPLSTLLNIVT